MNSPRPPPLGPAGSPAALFADQSMAFGRVGWAWYALVLERWKLPEWLRRGMLALARNRAVQARRGGTLGPIRSLARSLGMGGTAFPLGWNMSYDPIVWILGITLSICCPTYVDDLAALTMGPVHTFRARFLLLVAGHA